MVAHDPTLMRGVRLLLKGAVGGGFALAGLRLFFPPPPITSAATLLAWFGCAVGIGYGFARLWALPLAVIPCPGIWYTRLTGPEYLGYGDASWLGAVFLILPGFCGIALGAGLHRWALRSISWSRTLPAPSVELLLLAPVLVIFLLGATLDLARDRTFVRLPRPIEVRRYSDAEVGAVVAGLSFAVYGATTEGTAGGVSRRTLAPPGWPPTENVVVIYCDARCRRASEVQIQSAPPGFHRAAANPQVVKEPGRPEVGRPEKTVPPTPFETIAIAGTAWHVVASGPLPGTVKASADLDGASVQIYAPSRATFERVAANLRQIAPAPGAR